MYLSRGQERKPAIGLDISGGGLRVLLKERVEHPEIALVVLIAERPVALSAKVKWATKTRHQGQEHYLYGLKLAKISDHEWDRIMEWTLEEADPGAKLHLTVGATLTAAQRDIVIPQERQTEVAQRLVAKGRLDALVPGRLPLIEYKFEGYKMRGGVPYYRLIIRSRKTEKDHSMTEYRTNVLSRVEAEGVLVLD